MMGLLLPKRIVKDFRRNLCHVCQIKENSNANLKYERHQDWEAVIGLEIHAQINANSKIFSGSPTNYGAHINDAVSFFDASLPGTLPVLNKACVTAALKTALSLNSSINKISYFDRKHYFYADLPAGYQITQKRLPLAVGGYLHYPQFEGRNVIEKKVNLTQIQLEQDSGRSLHVDDNASWINLNRAGIGLMEIITEPDFRSAKEVMAFVKELQLILQTIGSCNGKMEEGSMRVDASISVRKPNDPLGVRTEVKNLNSIKSIGRAVEYEIERQIKSINEGVPVENQTMHYDVDADCTYALRDKEKVHDYRFMPEPNLVSLVIDDDLDKVRSELPMLPIMRRSKLMEDDGLTVEQSFVLVSFPELHDLYQKLTDHAKGINLKPSVANFCMNEILSLLNRTNISLKESCILDMAEIQEVATMLFIEKKINHSTAKDILDMLVDKNQKMKSARDIVAKCNMEQLSDDSELTRICLDVMEENDKAVRSFKEGKVKSINALIGQVQKKTGGRANGLKVSNILKDLMSK